MPESPRLTVSLISRGRATPAPADQTRRIELDGLEAGCLEGDDQAVHAGVVHEQVRALAEHDQVRVELAAARQFLGVLRAGQTVGAAADVEPGRDGGLFLDLQHVGRGVHEAAPPSPR